MNENISRETETIKVNQVETLELKKMQSMK